jgi:peptide/nickel transport system permease protein
MREGKVNYKYALRNALIPTVAMLGIAFGNMLATAIFVEVVFGRPGLGSMAYNAILTRDYPLIRGGVLTLAVFVIAANLIADIAYHALDPRMRANAR